MVESSGVHAPTRIGPYALQRELGRGGFGVVYEALHDDGQLWALKLISSRNARGVAELRHEARTLWDLDVPGVVCPKELGIEDSWVYLAMELVPGQPLSALRGTATVDFVERLLDALEDTMLAMHRSGLLHLDITPDNIIARPDGTFLLLDFGLARWRDIAPAGALLVDDELGGTAGFVAPELLRSEPAGTEADWYSLGAVAWWLLVGTPPRAPHLGRTETDPRLGRLADRVAALISPRPGRRGPRTLHRPVRFVGRQAELAWLRTPTAGLTVLHGEAGVGKSALVEESLVGTTALRGRCHPGDHAAVTGFEGIASALELAPADAVRSLAAVLLPSLGRATPAPVEACRRALSSLVARHLPGATVFVDDLHWMDPDSLAVLYDLLLHAGARVVCTMRPVPCAAATWLDRVEREGAFPVRRRVLGPMTDDESAELARSARGAEIDEVVRQAAGSPFAVQWLAAHAEGTSVAEGVRMKLDRLDPTERATLEVLALAGVPVRESFLRAAVSDVGAPMPSVPRMIRARWVSPRDDGSLEVYHALIAEHVAEAVSPQHAQHAHSALLTAFEREDRSDMAYRHAMALGDRERAAELAHRSGTKADSSGAPESALGWYQRTLELGAEPWLRTRRVQASAGRAALSAGRISSAEGHLRVALTHGPPSPDLVLWTAEAVFAAGRSHEALELLASLLVEHGVDPRRRLPVRVLAVVWGLLKLVLLPLPHPAETTSNASVGAELGWTLARGFAFTEPLRALDLAFGAMTAARSQGDTATLVQVLAFLGGGVFLQVPFLQNTAAKLLDHAAVLAAPDPQAASAASVDLWRGVFHIGRGDWTAARERLLASLERFDRIDRAHWERMTARQFVLWLDWWQADFNPLYAEAEAGLRAALQRDDVLGRAVYCQYRAYALIARGETAQVQADCAWLAEEWSKDGFTVQTFYAAVIGGMASLYDGRPAEAHERWSAVQADFRRAGGEQVPVSRIDNALHEARILLSSRPSDAGARLGALQKRLAREARRDGPAFAAWVAAARSTTRGSATDAASALDAAGCPGAADAIRLQAFDDLEAAERLSRRGCVEPARWARAYWPLGEIPK